MHECRISKDLIASSACKGLFALLSSPGLDLTAKRRSCVTVVSSSSSSRTGSDSNAGRAEPNPSCPAGILTCLLFSFLPFLSFPSFPLLFLLPIILFSHTLLPYSSPIVAQHGSPGILFFRRVWPSTVTFCPQGPVKYLKEQKKGKKQRNFKRDTNWQH